MLVFMVQGLKQTRKQHVGYYFTKDAAKTFYLELILAKVIDALQLTVLKVVCNICDQGTNIACIKQLANPEPEQHDYII